MEIASFAGAGGRNWELGREKATGRQAGRPLAEGQREREAGRARAREGRYQGKEVRDGA